MNHGRILDESWTVIHELPTWEMRENHFYQDICKFEAMEWKRGKLKNRNQVLSKELS